MQLERQVIESRGQLEAEQRRCQELQTRIAELESEVADMRQQMSRLNKLHQLEQRCDALQTEKDETLHKLAVIQERANKEKQDLLKDIKNMSDMMRRDHFEETTKRARANEEARQNRDLRADIEACAKAHQADRLQWGEEKIKLDEECRLLWQQCAQLRRCLLRDGHTAFAAAVKEDSICGHSTEPVKILEPVLPRLRGLMDLEYGDAFAALVATEGRTLAEVQNLRMIVQQYEDENDTLRAQLDVVGARNVDLELSIVGTGLNSEVQPDDSVKQMTAEVERLKAQLSSTSIAKDEAEAEAIFWKEEYENLQIESTAKISHNTAPGKRR